MSNVTNVVSNIGDIIIYFSDVECLINNCFVIFFK